MHVAKLKKPVWKGYTLHESNSMKFRKRQNDRWYKDQQSPVISILHLYATNVDTFWLAEVYSFKHSHLFFYSCKDFDSCTTPCPRLHYHSENFITVNLSLPSLYCLSFCLFQNFKIFTVLQFMNSENYTLQLIRMYQHWLVVWDKRSKEMQDVNNGKL